MADDPPEERPMIIPEDVYLDAARAYEEQLHGQPLDTAFDAVIAANATHPTFRAAVASAYRAGYGQGRDDEAAGPATPPDPLAAMRELLAEQEADTGGLGAADRAALAILEAAEAAWPIHRCPTVEAAGALAVILAAEDQPSPLSATERRSTR
jgi:hypothetical protein